jgi:hypothetical protein
MFLFTVWKKRLQKLQTALVDKVFDNINGELASESHQVEMILDGLVCVRTIDTAKAALFE